ncbi:MAG: SRPBCC family protein [Saprospiraceae bacterium]|nr:SRPBCC family protein [Pyrinomonadaceae bacterium]
MELKFQVQTKIQKPVEEVFDAVYNPEKLSGYFTTGGASGPLDEGTTVTWKWADYPVESPVNVKKVVPNESIVLEWEGAKELMTRVEMTFEKTGPEETLVKVAESGWRETQADLDSSYSNCHGWTQMTCALKAFLEHGINLRKGAYDKEMIEDMIKSAKG